MSINHLGMRFWSHVVKERISAAESRGDARCWFPNPLPSDTCTSAAVPQPRERCVMAAVGQWRRTLPRFDGGSSGGVPLAILEFVWVFGCSQRCAQFWQCGLPWPVPDRVKSQLTD